MPACFPLRQQKLRATVISYTWFPTGSYRPRSLTHNTAVQLLIEERFSCVEGNWDVGNLLYFLSGAYILSLSSPLPGARARGFFKVESSSGEVFKLMQEDMKNKTQVEWGIFFKWEGGAFQVFGRMYAPAFFGCRGPQVSI